VTVVPAGLDSWLAARRELVDAALQRFLPSADSVPSVLSEAMEYSVMAGGKRLRPMLVLAAAEATAEATGARVESALALAMPAACAVELIHTYSLVHDDLPAMDNDTLRRGRPTSHVVFGEGMAILSGDALLTEAFQLLAREPQSAADTTAGELAARKLETLQTIAQAAGAAGMVGGQAIDLQAAEPGAAMLDAAALRAMHARKTAALITGSAVAGAIMAGASSVMRDAVKAYASHLGLAFQIVDDVLDVEGASADLGKTAGKDAAAGKPTYPALYGLAESKRLAAECVERALAALSAGGIAGQLPAIARWVVSRTH
jgi:geranylgeranyl diphosphate synthase type II